MIPGSPQPSPAQLPGPPAPAQPQDPPPVTIDAVVQLLRDDRMRGFRIDVETDSLVEADQSRERRDRTEFVTAIGGFFKEFGPVVQQMPPLAPLAGKLLQFAVRGFKVGAELEETIEKAMQGVADHLANPPQRQPSPDEQLKYAGTQTKVAAEGQKAALGVQAAQQESAAKQTAAQLDLAGKVLDHHHKVIEHQMMNPPQVAPMAPGAAPAIPPTIAQ
jgi:hypothetical protein